MSKNKSLTVKIEDLISTRNKNDIQKIASEIKRKINREKRRQEKLDHKKDDDK